jgi:hypothetical protein
VERGLLPLAAGKGVWAIMTQKEKTLFTPQWWKEMGMLNLGTLLMAIGIYFFKFIHAQKL